MKISLKDRYLTMVATSLAVSLVLVKSTTLASNIRYVLENNTHIRGNILTHNEPIEYEYDAIESTHSIVSQSEIPNNFETFADANREAMRRRPAAVEIGELRDKETISAALELSLTGDPVFCNGSRNHRRQNYSTYVEAL